MSEYISSFDCVNIESQLYKYFINEKLTEKEFYRMNENEKLQAYVNYLVDFKRKFVTRLLPNNV